MTSGKFPLGQGTLPDLVAIEHLAATIAAYRLVERPDFGRL